MQVAYLILAHHQPAHLARLVRTLAAPEAAFFIHIDAKADLAAFEAAVGERSDSVFLRDRRLLSWGGFSIVEATLALVSAAYRSGRFQRFCLLSGSDLPIKNNSRIRSAFASQQEFLRIDRGLGPAQENSHCRNVNTLWFMDSTNPSLREESGKIRRPPYDGAALYHGAQWWALTRPCIEYVFAFLSAHPDYQPFFRFTLCPDECFFHSIVKQSPFASRITHDFEREADLGAYFRSNEHGCHYIDWNSPGAAQPKILDLGDLEKLTASACLFARKFDETKSSALLASLERL